MMIRSFGFSSSSVLLLLGDLLIFVYVCPVFSLILSFTCGLRRRCNVLRPGANATEMDGTVRWK